MLPKAPTSNIAAPHHLPEDQAKCVDVGTLERLKVLHVNSLIQDFRCHVAPRANTTVQCYVDRFRVNVVLDGETCDMSSRLGSVQSRSRITE